MAGAAARAFTEGRAVVVGIGEDGWAGLAEPSREALRLAGLVIGSPRRLGQLPPEVRAKRLFWSGPRQGSIGAVVRRHASRRLVLLASGDPLFYGLGRVLVDELGMAALTFLPHPSSVSLACARLGWPVEDVTVMHALGRDPLELLARLREGRRILVLSAGRETPGQLAAVLRDNGFAESRLVVLSGMGGRGESRQEGSAADWSGEVRSGLNVVALSCRRSAGAVRLVPAAGLPERAYPRDPWWPAEVRAVVHADLAPEPGQLLWEIGGGGAVAAEWMRSDPLCRAVLVEPRSDVLAAARQNASALGVPGIQTVTGHAPGALAGLPEPDAILVAGGLRTHGLLPACWDALPGGGRLVVLATTLESEAMVARLIRRLDGQARRFHVERAERDSSGTRWVSQGAVMLAQMVKPPADTPVAPDLNRSG